MVPCGWSGTIVPSKHWHVLTPTNRSFTNVIASTSADFTVTMPFSSTFLSGFSGGGIDNLVWGDYDGDGDLDLLASGWSTATRSTDYHTDQYRNDNGVFTDAFRLCSVEGSVAYGDYDNDGRLDVCLSSTSGTAPSSIYRNNGSSFTAANCGIPQQLNVPTAWVDFDHDGQLDLIAGATVYHNNGGGTFSPDAAILPSNKEVAWFDYDKDGDLDVAVGGSQNGGFCRIYRNDNGVFTDINAGLAGFDYGSLQWGDFNNDGRADLLALGSGLRIYRNDGNDHFVGIDVTLPSQINSPLEAVWGDFDNDGLLDIAAVGYNWLKIYRNCGNETFEDVEADYGLYMDNTNGAIAVGDFDGDGRLDFARGCYVYKNCFAQPNTRPTTPTGLTTNSGDGLAISWQPAADAQTPSAGLSYNVRVGSTPGGSDVVNGMALANGVRVLPALGNAGYNLSYTVKGLNPGIYYCSVQAIDGAFAGSSWSTAMAAIPDMPINTAKSKNEGSTVGLCLVTTSIDANGVYAEKEDRSGGIRIYKPGHGIALNRRVNVLGQITNDQATGECRLVASTIFDRGGESVSTYWSVWNPSWW